MSNRNLAGSVLVILLAIGAAWLIYSASGPSGPMDAPHRSEPAPQPLAPAQPAEQMEQGRIQVSEPKKVAGPEVPTTPSASQPEAPPTEAKSFLRWAFVRAPRLNGTVAYSGVTVDTILTERDVNPNHKKLSEAQKNDLAQRLQSFNETIDTLTRESWRERGRAFLAAVEKDDFVATSASTPDEIPKSIGQVVASLDKRFGEMGRDYYYLEQSGGPRTNTRYIVFFTKKEAPKSFEMHDEILRTKDALRSAARDYIQSLGN
jgi:hypothetical protein